jgi:23S rRNA pseudouridine2605 synthase
MPRKKFSPVNSSSPIPQNESKGQGEDKESRPPKNDAPPRKYFDKSEGQGSNKRDSRNGGFDRRPRESRGDGRERGSRDGGNRNLRSNDRRVGFKKNDRKDRSDDSGGRSDGDGRNFRSSDRRENFRRNDRNDRSSGRSFGDSDRRNKGFKKPFRDGADVNSESRNYRRGKPNYRDDRNEDGSSPRGREDRRSPRDGDKRGGFNKGGFKGRDTEFRRNNYRGFDRRKSDDRNQEGEESSSRNAGNNAYQRRDHEHRGKNDFRDRKPKKFNKRDPWNEENEVSSPKRVKRERVENPETRSKFGYKGSNRELEKAGKDLQKGSDLLKSDIRLNRYISNSGLCSRREADTFILQGLVTVNNDKITDLGTKVSKKDVVKVDGKRIMPEKPVYILLNKPKGYITTTNDPEGRKTIMELIDLPGKERIYPVGRLDRNTTGVLLLTNDGEVSQKLTHPSFEIKKIYRAKLNTKPSKEAMLAWVDGVELEDGYMAFEQIGFVDENDPTVLGLEIHSGRNRIVRRMFEHFKYDVEALDRVLLGEFDKIKLGRGKWRFLTDKEIRYIDRLKRTKPKPIDADSIKPKSQDLDNIDFE